MSNSDKNRHGKSFQESIEYFVFELNSKQELCKIEANKRLGYAGYDPEQFYIPYEIEFQDDTTWAVYSTTSMRDRFKCQLWDAYNLKQIDDRIEYALLVYPDSISEAAKKAFQNKARAIDDGIYYSSIDLIVSESEFHSMLEEKAMSSAGLSSGVRGDRRGKSFENHVVRVMNNVKNLSLAKGANVGVESGHSYSLFAKILVASGADALMVSSIAATSDIPCLPSGGQGKTDVVVRYRLLSGGVVEQKISCKRTLRDKVSVNQYPSSEIIRVLGIDGESNLAKAIRMYEECGSKKNLKERYGSSGVDFVCSTIEEGLARDNLYALTKWVVSGYGASNPGINCADYILISKGSGSEYSDNIYGVEEYVRMLLSEEPLQMGTPFDWTYASGQRGKSIQFKMRVSH